jgi:hypothetical protein
MPRAWIDVFWKRGIAAASRAAMVLAVLGVPLAAEEPKSPPKRDTARRLEIGKPAPDLELPLLKEEVGADGEKVGRITDEKVKLSSFRGRKVVCLFLSSYT